MTNVTVQEALKSAIEAMEYHTEQTRPIQKTIDTLALCKAALSEIDKCEPFGYFKAEPFGWTDCAETDEGAIALYEAPTVQREGWVSVPIEPTREMIDAAFVFLKDGGVENIDGDDIRGSIRYAIQAAPTDTE